MTVSLQSISSPIKRTLQIKFQHRVSFDQVERWLYSHDLGSPPTMIRPLISRRLAEGIVQPQAEAELIYLLQLANQHRIPLTPRGRGTSGYGGAVPRFGGLVVDFSRMNNILEIDSEGLTVTAEPGVIWLDLERKLAPAGLALRLYPSSAPSSTVAGWLAQGGSGFGSYEYGWFGENVIRAKLVQPDGKVVSYTADELDMLKDAEGITGFISQVSLKVRPAEALTVLAASFETADQLADMLASVVERRLKLWSVNFINPQMGRLRDTLRQQEGVFLAGVSRGYLATFVFPRAEERTEALLRQLIQAGHGRMLAPETSARLWGKRFDILKIRKLAPSLISTKVAIPLKSLGVVLKNSHRIKQPLVIEGVILQDKSKSAQAVLLGFIPYDERKIGYNLVYALALSFIRLAGEVGGRPCATGIYFKHQAANIIGPARLKRLISHKRIVDPQNILNPGKVIGKDCVDLFMGLAWNFEPLIRLLANRIPPLTPGNVEAISWQAYCCDQCGFCLSGCSKFYGWESQGPRGRWYLLRLIMQGRLKLEEVISKFQPCSECQECKIACPQGLPPIRAEMLKAINLTAQQSQGIIKRGRERLTLQT